MGSLGKAVTTRLAGFVREADASRFFAKCETPVRPRLVEVSSAFARGYQLGLHEQLDAPESSDWLALPTELQAFAWEGLGMALALLDVYLQQEPARWARFSQTHKTANKKFAAVGVGWAGARINRIPSVGLESTMMEWVYDGYGFHCGLFSRHRGSPTSGAYKDSCNHGLGRSLWFSYGGDPERIARMISKCPRESQPIYWRGVGLACAFTGGADANTLRFLRTRSGNFRPEFSAGVEHALGLRNELGTVPPCTKLAEEVILRNYELSATDA